MMRSWILAAVMVLVVHMAQAQRPAGADPLLQLCSGFLDQNGVAIKGDANRLCGCLVREVQGKLSRPEMETYDRANAAGQPLPASLQNKITGIAVRCLTEAR
jgi:hypothetical protein